MFVKATSFQIIQFIDKSRKDQKVVIIPYALGEDGILYEFANGTWRGFPITIQPGNGNEPH
jgi:hypothetical protein